MAAQEELAGAGGQLQVAELVTWQARFPGPEVIEVSGNAVEVLGYASEALLGPLEAFLVHVHAEERDEARRVIEGLNAGESISFECRAVRLGGDEIRVRHVAFRSSDDGGRLAGAVVDLTESITAHALLGAEAKTRAILDTAVDGIIAIDDVGLIQSTNPAAMKLFGYAEEELLGRNVSML
ncbi:MAG: PAS domain S-box protein, partial [Dehalococcoidia bacterium]|nr:PAS domain S-box protein [Dehalococcoidia bacterium]